MSLDAVYQGKSTCSKIVKANIQNVDSDKGTLVLSDVNNPTCTLSAYIDSRFSVLFPTQILANVSLIQLAQRKC